MYKAKGGGGGEEVRRRRKNQAVGRGVEEKEESKRSKEIGEKAEK